VRGSVFYQTSLLAKAVFEPGSSKLERVGQAGGGQMMVASYKTMDTYRRVWNNIALFVREEYGLKDLSQLNAQHIEGFMLSKIDIAPSRQYMEKISSALGKLEYALTCFNDQIGMHQCYDFSIRQQVLTRLKQDDLVYDGYRNRVYMIPQEVISTLKEEVHRLAAQIQLQSGARFEGIGLIKRSQIKRAKTDPLTGRTVVPIETREKGGNIGMINICKELAEELMTMMQDGIFKIDYQRYTNDIRHACQTLKIKSEGSHGFRWCFAQRRMNEYQRAGYSYNESTRQVSLEMKHRRACITEHYYGIQPAR
jgi:hypothetical protein